MVGAYATFLAVAVLALIDLTALPLPLTLVLLAAAAVGAVHGLATDRVVFRPLRHARSQAPLIATIGLAILLQEYLRLTQGAGDRWIQPVLTAAHELAAGDGFVVALSTAQILILLMVPCLYGGLWLLMRRSAVRPCGARLRRRPRHGGAVRRRRRSHDRPDLRPRLRLCGDRRLRDPACATAGSASTTASLSASRR